MFCSNNDINNTVNYLEKGLYLKERRNTKDISDKIKEFSNWFNTSINLSLTKYEFDRETIVDLLTNLKQKINSALEKFERSKKLDNKLICNSCNKPIVISPAENYWNCLQDHKCIEVMLCQVLNKELPKGIEMERKPLQLGGNTFSSNDIRVNNVCNEAQTVENDAKASSSSNESLRTNENVCNGYGFKFDFKLERTDEISKKIYPEGWMEAVKKIDLVKDLYTVQKCGPSRVRCLLCPCELNYGRVSKFVLQNHAMGNKHLRYSTTKANLDALARYHKDFSMLDPKYQAHQIYFSPSSKGYKCVLCNSACNEIVEHILTEKHKLKVLTNFEKNSKTVYLMPLQVQAYGITEVPKRHENFHKEIKPIVKPGTTNNKGEEHNIIKAVANGQENNILSWVPNRLKEHLKFLKSAGNTVQCTVCFKSFPGEMQEIKFHLISPQHCEMSKIAEIDYKFFCEICNMKLKDEVDWDNHFTKGPNTHINVAETRKPLLCEYECTNCHTVIFGDEVSLNRHKATTVKNRKKKEFTLPLEVKALMKTKKFLAEFAEELTQEANEVLEDNEATLKCLIDMETAISNLYEGCKAYPFGSRISGLGNRMSDLDVFIDIGDMYMGNKNQDCKSQISIVKNVYSMFRAMKKTFSHPNSIPSARTPIVQIYHIETDLDCDLSFRHGLSVENTKYLKFCIRLQPFTQKMILILKKWSECCQLQEHISTYAFSMMVIFYLQINNYLPSVARIRELNPSQSLLIDGWETVNLNMDPNEIKKHLNECNLDFCSILAGFFNYYNTFNFSSDIVCPLLGRTVKKSLFDDVSNLPKEMDGYKRKLSSEEPEYLRVLSPFCIQDPFDLSHNLTKACTPNTIAKFKSSCELTYKFLGALKE